MCVCVSETRRGGTALASADEVRESCSSAALRAVCFALQFAWNLEAGGQAAEMFGAVSTSV